MLFMTFIYSIRKFNILLYIFNIYKQIKWIFMIFNFNKFISEELKIDKMDDATLEDTKSQLMFRLSEYRVYILANINYNMLTNKIEYKNFDRIDIKVIMRELTN